MDIHSGMFDFMREFFPYSLFFFCFFSLVNPFNNKVGSPASGYGRVGSYGNYIRFNCFFFFFGKINHF